MSATKKTVLVMMLLLLLASLPFASAMAGFESLYYGKGLSRGMVMYFVALVALLAIPLMNRYLKTLAFYVIVFTLSRGLMRITDEQDPFRALLSAESGLELGLKIAIPLVVISLSLVFAAWVLTRLKATPASSSGEIIDYINRGRRQGKTLEQLRRELGEQGIKDSEINRALAGRDE